MQRAIRKLLRLTVAALTFSALSCAANAETAKPKPLSEGELAQLFAPIALYPDAILAQVLMASTYPLDVVQAARWAKTNPKVTGKALEDAMQKQPWDPSVKSLTAVPTVLQMMSEKLDWTQKLGDAFLAQQADVMNVVQILRARAQAAGTLQNSTQQTVTTKTVSGSNVIIIEQAQPQVIYVPAYNPTIVYGTWYYAAYPPYYWYPPGYVATRAVWFTTGVFVGAAIWGNCNWGRHDVDININRYNSFNRTTINNVNWNHNTARRGAVPYRDPQVAQRYNRTPPRTAQRDLPRGRVDTPRQRTATPSQQPRPSGMDRPRAYDDLGRGKDVRKYSSRGSESRKSATQNRTRTASRPRR